MLGALLASILYGLGVMSTSGRTLLDQLLSEHSVDGHSQDDVDARREPRHAPLHTIRLSGLTTLMLRSSGSTIQYSATLASI